LAALLMAAALPVTYFSASHYRILGGLEASARLHAAEVVELARRNPAFWEFDGLRVSGPRGRSAEERRRVYARGGHLVMEAAPRAELPWPIVTQQAPIIVDGEELGHVEAALSLRGVLVVTLLVSLASTTLGVLIFVLLRVVPLRLLNQALARASFLAAHDLLTGLPNRGLFGDRLRQALARSRRDGKPMAVLCLDLDRFKEVNDTLGHAAGDELLKVVSARLSAMLRESDTLARLGGDEFAVIQPQAKQPQAAATLASRLIAALEAPIDLDGYQARIGVSIGIAMTDRDGSADPAQLLRDADLALYQAKEAGRGGYCLFVPEMNHKLQERRAMEADLRRALETDGFRLVFQPQVQLDRGTVTGAEALLRWDRPGSGAVPPTRFIPVAEDAGLITPIGNWVLRQACRQAMDWPQDTTVAVNVSPVQFRQS
ncbi:diguanylate cyclase, partial [Roseomonas sp. SSH11]